MKRNLMNELKEGFDFLADERIKQQVKEELAHIEKPYSLEKILEQYSSGSYNAELLLQHALLLLVK
jgi:hypothetical protein